MNLPKKLFNDKSQFPSFFVDENGKPVGTVLFAETRPQIKKEIIKRYNGYNTLLAYSIVISVMYLAVVIWNLN